MTETATTPEEVPVITADPFSPENLADPLILHEQLREAGPVFYLDAYGIWGMARFEQVNAALKDWKTFSSAAGVGLSDFRKEKPWRTPSLLLEADPPAHTFAREVIGPVLSPRALEALREQFEREANALVERLVALGSFDAVTQLSEAYPLKVFGDAVGVPEEGREYLLSYGHLAFNAFGPRNQLLANSMTDTQAIQQWIASSCTREVEVSGVRIPVGEKVLLFLGAANRDPRRWTNPNSFDIRCNASGHVGFGMGIHRCVGLTVARVEGEILLTTLARRVERIDLTGQPQRKLNNTLRAWSSIPVTVSLAAFGGE